jgi:hypothetical protein
MGRRAISALKGQMIPCPVRKSYPGMLMMQPG